MATQTKTTATTTSPVGTSSGLPSPGGYGVGVVGYDKGDGFRLSAKTCLAMLARLDDLEVEQEIEYLNAYYPDIANRTRLQGIEAKRNFLEKNLNSTFHVESNKIVSNFNLLLESFFRCYS